MISVRIDRIRVLEELKAAAAAAQARETAAFAAARHAADLAAGVKAAETTRSVAAQVGLARRISPFHARRYLGWAGILTRELPGTFAELSAGRSSEWRALLVARETAWLSREHRAVVDAELAPRLEQLGDRRTEADARQLAYRLDPQGAVAKVRGAASDRRVSLRPAPEAMTRLTALLPVAQGVAAYAALSRDADTAVSEGEPRSRGQIMADTLVERITGQATAEAVPVEVHLLMSTDTLLDDGSEPAVLHDGGPIPAPIARAMVLDTDAPVWLRRLFTRPDTGQLIAAESRRRFFQVGQRRWVRDRDQYCRTPYCEARIRHTDHVRPAAAGGPTRVRNARGQCEACNYVNQARGWRSRVRPNPRGHDVEIVTPTGHRYRSRPPDPPVAVESYESPVEARLRELLDAA